MDAYDEVLGAVRELARESDEDSVAGHAEAICGQLSRDALDPDGGFNPAMRHAYIGRSVANYLRDVRDGKQRPSI